MSASVLFTCGLNEQQLPPYVHISEESKQDGSFLISCILGQRLRISNAGTILICLQHNFKHYLNAGLRLGYNAGIFVGKTLSVIDPVSEISMQNNSALWTEFDREITTLLLERITEELKNVSNDRIGTTILIDNLAILHQLGATQAEVIQFCLQLAKLSAQYENVTVVTKLNNCDIYASLDLNIAKLANVAMRLVKLTSGIFREVDGKLKIKRTLKVGTYNNETLNKEVLYKVNDRNIKIFNPGEVGV